MSQLPPIIGVTVLGLAGYLAGESIFADRIHPVHWVVAVAGGLIGWLGGYAVAWAMNR
jgi:membrane protein DedA with SNARE-associated domain